mmetsp:Transcript_13249/g.34317  ORF Transcript_13249/g.34317 Transcript_13249/m.34317 type:complete len:474 (-) Transcript_13249:54-1475(-)
MCAPPAAWGSILNVNHPKQAAWRGRQRAPRPLPQASPIIHQRVQLVMLAEEVGTPRLRRARLRPAKHLHDLRLRELLAAVRGARLPLQLRVLLEPLRREAAHEVGVPLYVGDGQAARGVLHQQVGDEVAALGGQPAGHDVVARHDAGERGVAALRLALGAVLLAVEGKVAAEQRVQQHAAAPDVGLLAVIRGVLQHLGRDVLRRAHARLGHRLVVGLREPKVAQLDLRRVVGREQDVLQFDVSTDDALAVHVVNGADDLLEEVQRLALAEAGPPVLHDVVEQVALRQVLHDEAEVALAGHRHQLDEAHDVGVAQPAVVQDLPLQPLGVPLLRVHKLYGHLLPGGAAHRQPHPAVAAVADLLLHGVPRHCHRTEVRVARHLLERRPARWGRYLGGWLGVPGACAGWLRGGASRGASGWFARGAASAVIACWLLGASKLAEEFPETYPGDYAASRCWHISRAAELALDAWRCLPE